MGTDIHAYVETKKDGEWHHLNWQEDYIEGEWDDGSPKYDYGSMMDDLLYIGRNYNLFSVLANVRNGYGFAGVTTGQGYEFIDEPRDLPEDVTDEVKQKSERWGVDGHNHSWFTVSELLEFDWEGKRTVNYGVVGPLEYKVYKNQGKPTSWSGGVSGKSVKMLTNDEMEELLDSDKTFNAFGWCEDDDMGYFTRVSWKESYAEAVGDWWFDTLDELKELGDPDKVRLVFWFDC